MVSSQDRIAWLNERLAILDHEPVVPLAPPRTSVVGVDGTEDSQDAAAWARLLTEVSHVVYAQVRGHSKLGASPAALEGLAKDGRFAIDLVSAELKGAAVTEHVVDASPAKALHVAEATARELVVLHSAPEDLERMELEGFTDTGPGHRARLIGWPPEKGLAGFLEERRAGLLVLGHGRHRGWLGSTALKLLRSAPTAVLVVPEVR